MYLISNNVWAIFFLRDYQQITFFTLNRFCLLRKPHPPPLIPLFFTDKTKLDRIPSKIKWKIHVFWNVLFEVFKALLIKECKIQLVCQFLHFLLLYIASEFTSTSTDFYNILEPNPTFTEKKVSSRIFILWRIHPNWTARPRPPPPPPL